MSARSAPLALSAGLFAVVAWLVALPLIGVGWGIFWTARPGDPGGHFSLLMPIETALSGDYGRALVNTLVLAGLTTAIATPLGIGIAWLTTRTDMPMRRLLGRAMLLPIFLSPLVGVLSWIALASPRSGFINTLAATTLGTHGPLINVFTLAGMVLVMVLHYTSYAYIYGISAFALDGSFEEASTVSGAGILQTLRHVVMPLALPSILASGLMIFVLAAEQFPVPGMLGRPARFETLPSMIYYHLEYSPTDTHGATVAGGILICVTVLGLLLLRHLLRNGRKFVTVGGKGMRAPRLVRLPRAVRWSAFAGTLTFLLLALVLPLIGIVLGSLVKFLPANLSRAQWTLDNYRVVFSSEFHKAVLNTAVLAVVVSIGTTLLGVLVAYYIVQRWRGASLLDGITSLPTALPGLALALGFLWIYTMLPISLYGTIWILMIAYACRFLAHGVRLCSAGLTRLGPELDEAARISGAGPLRRLFTIQMPLIRGNLGGAVILLFIYATIEVSSTIVLYSTDSITVSVFIWRGMQMSGSVQVFAVAVMQTLVIGTLVAVSARWLDPREGRSSP
jgi:iron(III) transport system permease protein